MTAKVVITKADISENKLLLCSLIENDKLTEVRILGTDSDTPLPDLGNIYVGKVQRVVKNLNAAFVEIAPGMPCYLPLEHVKDPVYVKRNSGKKLLAEGDELLVQVQREAMKTKAPMVSTNLNLPGRDVVITTEKKQLGISSKLSAGTRARWKELLRNTKPERYGVIIRTNAANADEEAVLCELRELTRQMDDMVSHAWNRTCFSCLYRSMPGYLAFLQNTYSAGLAEIVTDQPEIYHEIFAYCAGHEELNRVPLRLYEDLSYPLASLYNLNRQMERALAKTVFLKSGASIVIEPTEAMTVIDVNTAKSVAGKDPQKHFKQVNREAAKEIARQIRLRNLSGIIIVNFIDLDRSEDQEELLSCMREAVQADPVPVTVHDITCLNLVEMTRKKTGKSLAEQVRKYRQKQDENLDF
ncbi:MAG: ribonuclease E/G [Clostridiales bacterium]|nr:ribonuclease E/G [Clostridiales bacterium]